MRLAAVAAAVLLPLVAAPSALAQDTDIGGSVDSLLRLGLDDDVSGFETFDGPGEYDLLIRASVTSTANHATLSIADGDIASGNRLGRMAGGGSLLDEPLEARVGSAAFEPLDAAVDPILAAFGPVSNERVNIRLLQRIRGGERARGTYEKTLLITLSANAP